MVGRMLSPIKHLVTGISSQQQAVGGDSDQQEAVTVREQGVKSKPGYMCASCLLGPPKTAMLKCEHLKKSGRTFCPAAGVDIDGMKKMAMGKCIRNRW